MSTDAVEHLAACFRRNDFAKTLADYFTPRVAGQVLCRTIDGYNFALEIMQENDVVCVFKQLSISFFAVAQRFFRSMPGRFVLNHRDPGFHPLALERK